MGRPPALAGWGLTLEGTRAVPAEVAGLRAADVPRLRLLWAFAFPGARQVRSQPAVGGGALFVGGQDGTVYALDAETGCVRWTFAAGGEVRTSPVLEPWTPGDAAARPRLFFGDVKGDVYAVDAASGALVWKTRADPHPYATLTGSPRLFEGRLYVPLSSTEWAAAADPAYPCCSFRGGVAALDAASGAELWRARTIPSEPSGGRASAGAAVWNQPTVDARRRRLYVGTGQGYTAPAHARTDAVVAFALDDGRALWSYQSVADDAWTMAGAPARAAEPGKARDLDIGAPPVLHRGAAGQDWLIAGQKSAHVFALDPQDGRLLWRRKLARGGAAGGVHWGLAATETTLYAPLSEGEASALVALEPSTGKVRWKAKAPDACRGRPGCRRGFSAPPTAIPGAVFQPGLDGWLRAYAEADGKLLWAHDTTAETTTVSGAKASGGSIDAVGAVVSDGRVIIGSGYLYGSRMPGDVLLVYGAAPGP